MPVTVLDLRLHVLDKWPIQLAASFVTKTRAKYVVVPTLTVFGILKNIQDTWLACHFVEQTFMNLSTAQDAVAIIARICV